MSTALIADTGGLLRALANDARGKPTWPDYTKALITASAVIVPALTLAEIDYFLRNQRQAMRRLVAEILDPMTRYELEPTQPADLVRALEIDAKFDSAEIGLVDGMVAAVAERRRVYRVLTIDRAHFSTIRVGPKYQQPLTIVP